MDTPADNDVRESRVVGIVDLTTGRAVVDGPAGPAPTMGRLSRPVEIIDSETGETTYEHTVDLTGEGE